MGGTIATFMSYAMEKSLSKHPEKFGKGAIEGLAAPEASNNACSCGAMVPLLTLGIPGSGTTAVMLGALMLLGVRPGLFVCTAAGNRMGSHCIHAGRQRRFADHQPSPRNSFSSVAAHPQRIMLPLILGMAFMGTYFLNYSPL